MIQRTDEFTLYSFEIRLKLGPMIGIPKIEETCDIGVQLADLLVMTAKVRIGCVRLVPGGPLSDSGRF
jgi:hypothetical protein